MAYCTTNFVTKKALKEAVARHREGLSKTAITCFQPGLGLGPDLSQFTGSVFLEGPHFPQPHKWYAQAQLVNGVVVSVK